MTRRSPLRPGLAERLRQALDPLRARLRRDELREIAAALGRVGIHRDAPPLALALALVDRADALAAEARRLDEALTRLDAAQRAWGRAAEAALLAGARDAGAALERRLRALGRAHGGRELCLAAAGALAEDGLAAARLDETTRPGPLDPEGALAGRLVGHGRDATAPWTVRVAALEAAGRVLAAAWWPPDPSLVDALDALAADAGANRWTQIAALRALGGADRARARARARARLLAPAPGLDDAIVRARLVRLLTGELRDVEAGAVLTAAARDGSEHVRQSVARACLASGEVAARDLLEHLADPAREASPRVRAVAAGALAARAVGAAGDPERTPAAHALAAVIRRDPDPLARRVAADAAAAVVAEPTIDADDAAILCAALDVARAATDLPPAALNAVARAAERARAAVSPQTAPLRQALGAAVAGLDERDATAITLPLEADDATIGRALATLAQDDFGLYARRDGRIVVVRRGERVGRSAWRILYELTHPVPSKRQGHLHTVGRRLDAPLRAHPARLAEVTRTRVPGERVYVGREGGWAAWLPLVDDLLSTALADDEPALILSEHGTTEIVPPDGLAARLAARARLTTRYAELAELRLHSIEATDAHGRGAYLAAVARLGFQVRFRPWPEAPAPRHVRELFPPVTDPLPAPAPQAARALAPAVPLGELARALGSPGDGGVMEIAAFTAGAVALLAARSGLTRAEIAACRRAIPLVVGGWGTRGKSGVERLKAALFHALGYEVLVKTTGCEATLLVGTPGRPLRETPLYRPYEKATIWEQRDVLRLARRRRPHVLLWECMALNPRYVDLLQRGWMRDDISTLTNAYPDHEDVQGPTGVDVARVIAGFTPARATLVTAEEQMLPIIRERARGAGTRLVAVGPYDHELLPAELLERFPYKEHPRNVALVLALAEELGVDREIALVEMADHVLPDIGGLMTYGPFEVAGRRVRFTNGMSANERASALGNWRRLGFDAHRADAEPGRWIVAFVNNRADRAARTLTFAEAIVEDLAAHRYLLVGTNLTGLRRAIDDALARRLKRLRAADAEALLEHLKLGPATPAAAAAELAAWTGEPWEDEGLAEALEPAGPEPLAEARRAVADVAARLRAARGEEVARFAAESWARRRVAAGVRREPDSDEARRALGELFRAALVEPPDPLGDGPELMDALARACPPGVLADVMGVQNIKGPGLAVVNLCAALERHGGSVPTPAGGGPRRVALRRAWAWVRRTLDHVPSVGRRRRADRLLEDLADGRLSCEGAAAELERLLMAQRR